MKSRTASRRAFTLVELLVIIALVAVVAVIQLPALASTKSKVHRVHCSDNLKRVGGAFRTWAENHNDRMPMSVASSQGGGAGAVGIVATAAWTGGANPNANRGVYWMFMVMSNELTTPKILYCPSENAQSHSAAVQIGPQATVFGPQSASANAPTGYQNDRNVSYFVGVDANDAQSNMLLAGDHNLGTGANQATKVSSFTSAGTNSFWTATAIGWQDNNHFDQGNVLLADGSVQNFTTAQFRTALTKSGDFGRSPGVFANAPGSTGVGMNRLQFP